MIAGANDGMLHAFTSWQYDRDLQKFVEPDDAAAGEVIGGAEDGGAARVFDSGRGVGFGFGDGRLYCRAGGERKHRGKITQSRHSGSSGRT